jgi:uncharacterized damage-inducible protein DinB
MPDLANTVASGFANHFENIAAKLHKWVKPLTNDQIWRNPFSYGNSVGHLVLHLTGNLSYYIGAQIAGSGYVRNRDREFTESVRPSKEETLIAFDHAIQLVVATIRKQSATDWSAEYSGELSKEKNRFAVLLRCAAHADHHLGQIIYLSKELAKQNPVVLPRD